MAMYYVAHTDHDGADGREHAEWITNKLQRADTQNTYICPVLVLSHLKFGAIGEDAEREIRLDLLSVCDRLIVVGDVEAARDETNFARLVGMEVVELEEDGALRPVAV